jgi:hypothetical protein
VVRRRTGRLHPPGSLALGGGLLALASVGLELPAELWAVGAAVLLFAVSVTFTLDARLFRDGLR